MLITDYSEQDFQQTKTSHVPFSEMAAAGMIFVLPIIFLLLLSAS